MRRFPGHRKIVAAIVAGVLAAGAIGAHAAAPRLHPLAPPPSIRLAAGGNPTPTLDASPTTTEGPTTTTTPRVTSTTTGTPGPSGTASPTPSAAGTTTPVTLTATPTPGSTASATATPAAHATAPARRRSAGYQIQHILPSVVSPERNTSTVQRIRDVIQLLNFL